jgi:hypothetical protein
MKKKPERRSFRQFYRGRQVEIVDLWKPGFRESFTTLPRSRGLQCGNLCSKPGVYYVVCYRLCNE